MTTPEDSVTVVHVDADTACSEAVDTALERELDRVTLQTARTPADGWEVLAEDTVDCLVFDHDLPGADGIDFLDSVREDYPDLPAILYTGSGSEAVASRAISAGVTDYLRKDQHATLAGRIRDAVPARQSTPDRASRDLEQILATVPSCVVQLDRDGQFVFANDRAVDVLGLEESTLTDRTYNDPEWEITDLEGEPIPDDQLPFRQVRDPGEPLYGFQHTITWPDGTRKILDVNGAPLFDSDGAIERVVFSLSDITDRIERERDLERARDLLAQTERIADVGGWEIDTDTMDVFWTDHLFELLGVDYETEPPLEEALDVYHEDDRATVEHAVETAIEDGEAFDIEVRFRQPDGELRWLRVQGNPTVEDGEVMTLRGAVQDVTERKQREDRLRETTSRLEALFDHSPDMIDLLAPDGTILEVNRRFCEELGYTESDVVGEPIWEVDQLVDRADVEELLSDFAMDERRKFEGRYERQDGSTLPVEVHLLRLELAGAERFLAISRDITERKEHEQQLQEHNERLERFASVVSHDLRNPLNVVSARLDMANEECDSDHLDVIEQSTDRMTALVEDLLTLTRQGNAVLEPAPVALGSVIRDCWTTVETPEASVRIDTDRSVLADESRLHQLFSNLIRNSVEHGSTSNRTQSGDAVEHGGESVTITVGDLADGFYIEDDGPGIPPEDREAVLEAGYSTTDTGTGFGLSIVNQVVETHDWEITVTESTAGGARFEITGVEFAN